MVFGEAVHLRQWHGVLVQTHDLPLHHLHDLSNESVNDDWPIIWCIYLHLADSCSCTFKPLSVTTQWQGPLTTNLARKVTTRPVCNWSSPDLLRPFSSSPRANQLSCVTGLWMLSPSAPTVSYSDSSDSHFVSMTISEMMLAHNLLLIWVTYKHFFECSEYTCVVDVKLNRLFDKSMMTSINCDDQRKYVHAASICISQEPVQSAFLSGVATFSCFGNVITIDLSWTYNPAL